MRILSYIITIALFGGAIYWKNSSNETKLNEYFQQHQCTNIVLHRSEYKAVCQDKVILIEDFFFLDMNDNTEIVYKDIDSAERVGKIVILHNKELELKEAEPRLYFGSEESATAFAQGVNSKLKQ